MVRADWLNLNGLWQFDTSGDILVPFPVESVLSESSINNRQS
jgi:hypothetical protein